ncbi:hypothetical protein V8B55DRAFT_1598746 [Mucor lusitanicus]|uniref:HNH nuclease domain-containing protein n=2 Tax=Mucor circinelloides f. lusitanicus TaxID=29924 RepID=A0A168LSJ5_MUCCL|nr:hypothetical protein FB192DRAFT_1460875 [Mucor lusitanicus]OAD03907.1 hypothetical protein MUCCIDRAFT_110783 [Mucor lusitanicus CBS 277.49]
MVLSFYKGMYQDGDRLLDVLHDDRDPGLLRIDTLVPIFTWPQLQSYCIYRLNQIDGENYRVALSKYPEEYTSPKYLVGDRGSIFSLITLAMMTPEAGTYAMFNLTPTYQNDEGKIRKKRVQGHILVASTFLPNMGPDKEVHHLNRHPRDNTVENLVCLTHEEHVAVHSGLPRNNDYQDAIARVLENTRGTCLQQLSNLTEYDCKTFFCNKDIQQHQKTCWYHEHKDDPEFNKFETLCTDDGPLDEYEINRKGEIRRKRTTTIVQEFHAGYANVRCKSTSFDSSFKKLRFNRLIGFTFLAEDFTGGDCQADHINSNRRLNHIRNIRWLPRRENVLEACGINVVVENTSTKERVYFRSLIECAEVHTFYRDPKKRLPPRIQFHLSLDAE